MARASTVTLADVGAALAKAGEAADVYRSVIGVITDLDGVADVDVAAAIDAEPDLTGDRHIDAVLAAVAEHLAFHRDAPAPRWVFGADRFLSTAWFPVDLPSIRVTALVSSPASFRRRNIFIDRRDLDRV